jgi:hypothetical protein
MQRGKSFRYNFGTTSVQLRERRKGFLAPKRTPDEALGFLNSFVRDRGSEVQILSPRPYLVGPVDSILAVSQVSDSKQ